MTVTGVQSFDATTKQFGTCTNAISASAMQKITLRVSSPDGKALRSIDIVAAERGTQPVGQPLTCAGRELSVLSLGNTKISGYKVYGTLAESGDKSTSSS